MKRLTLKQIEPSVSWQDAMLGPVKFKSSDVGYSMLISKSASWWTQAVLIREFLHVWTIGIATF